MHSLLAVAAGGAIGAVARYLLSAQIMRVTGFGFPFGTLSVNVLGGVLMGLLVSLFALHWNAGQELRLFLTVGLLGGFTTFSTFSMETILLFERGQWMAAGLYVLASVSLALAGFAAGQALVRLCSG
ncbi:fluoride efflux transporter CrcB [Fodinicurvata fenggangensis]|uniref:fluoride efflux transporter CrcB n=1 Tax=Fodinicurvata fenggangensis TaxID=1121830 RepID=UPI00047E39DB|nr:fluoride efflux transporter CrcB [Fodinicurvata fenggangensis]